MEFQLKIDAFLIQSQLPPSKFGRLAVRDPRFVFDLRNGREPTARTAARVHAFIAGFCAGQARAAVQP